MVRIMIFFKFSIAIFSCEHRSFTPQDIFYIPTAVTSKIFIFFNKFFSG